MESPRKALSYRTCIWVHPGSQWIKIPRTSVLNLSSLWFCFSRFNIAFQGRLKHPLKDVGITLCFQKELVNQVWKTNNHKSLPGWGLPCHPKDAKLAPYPLYRTISPNGYLFPAEMTKQCQKQKARRAWNMLCFIEAGLQKKLLCF